MSETDPELYFAKDGTPRSGRFGDIYYSLQDGLSESRAVFLQGCRLPQDWQGRPDYTILELGFGTGLNILAVMQMWEHTRPTDGHLHIFSIEGFLMEASAARQALSAWPELAQFAEALLAQWPKARRGFHCMDFPQWGVSLTLGLMDVREALSVWHGPADSVFLDGFSPALNPDMWAEDVLTAVAKTCAPGARLATFTVAGFVRRGLQGAGFTIEKCPGFGKKRERLEAIFGQGRAALPARRPQKVAIIGAGIAGCALANQAHLLGLATDVFDGYGVGSGASGNVAALVTPRLDAGDNEISALFADAFAYACALYERLCPEAIVGKGVQQAEATPRDGSRFARIKTQAGFASEDLSLFRQGEALDMPDAKGITLNTALWIKPLDILKALLDGVSPIAATISSITLADDGHTLRGMDGQTYSGYDAVVVACGEGIFDLADYRARYDLRPVRGQVECVETQEPLQMALSWGGYAIPFGDRLIFGATHEREDRGADVREADRVRNLDSLAKAMPKRADAIKAGPFESRASIRVMTRDYLPVIGRTDEGVWLLTGLGARGFCLAPLLAKAVWASMLGTASPVATATANMLKPGRLVTHP